MTKRKSYKTLYLSAAARANDTKARYEMVEEELARLRGILSYHFEKETLTEMEAFVRNTPSGTDVALYPLSYEAMRAWLKLQERMTTDTLPVSAGFETMRFKDRRVVCLP